MFGAIEPQGDERANYSLDFLWDAETIIALVEDKRGDKFITHGVVEFCTQVRQPIFLAIMRKIPFRGGDSCSLRPKQHFRKTSIS